jgi:hypothetical protein
MKTEKAIKSICQAIKKDKIYKNVWVSNIAMSYIESEYKYIKENSKKSLNKSDKIKIANIAAENFLKLLCS